MSSDFLTSMMGLLIGTINKLIAIVLAPISALIAASIPGIDTMFAQVAAWLNYATTYVGWVVDAFGIPPIVCTIVVLYYTFVFTSSFSVFSIKLGIKWYGALKP